MFQMRSDPSSPAVARSFPSGLKVRERTEPSWPDRLASRFRDATSQIRTLGLPDLPESRLEEARRRPSGLNASDATVAV